MCIKLYNICMLSRGEMDLFLFMSDVRIFSSFIGTKHQYVCVCTHVSMCFSAYMYGYIPCLYMHAFLCMLTRILYRYCISLCVLACVYIRTVHEYEHACGVYAYVDCGTRKALQGVPPLYNPSTLAYTMLRSSRMRLAKNGALHLYVE